MIYHTDFHFLRTLRLAASLAPLLLLSSCETDYYDKGDGEYSQMRADFVEAHADGARQLDYFVTDDGDSLRLTQPIAAKWVGTADSVYRALVYYNKVDGTLAQPLSSSQVPVPRVKPTAEFEGGVKTDPVKFESAWLSRNKKYLNFGLALKTGSTDDDSAVHRLGMACDTIVQHADGTRTYHLRLYHDQGGRPEYYSQRTFFSIALGDYDADTMCVSIQTYDGLVTRVFPTR